MVCKRILGMPGDVVQREAFRGDVDYVIPPYRVWLEGDNKKNSTDSRTYGPVPESLLRGKVVFKVYPFREMGWVKHGDFEVEQVM